MSFSPFNKPHKERLEAWGIKLNLMSEIIEQWLNCQRNWMYLHPYTPTPYLTPFTLHPTPYTLHPTPYTMHPTPCTLHPTPYTLHPTPCTLHPTPFVLPNDRHPTPS
jgi:hypothetical protein